VEKHAYVQGWATGEIKDIKKKRGTKKQYYRKVTKI